MTADPSNAAPPRARFPIGLKLGLLATLLAVAPLSVVGFVLIDVNADAVESLSREVQLLALEDITQDGLNGYTDGTRRRTRST